VTDLDRRISAARQGARARARLVRCASGSVLSWSAFDLTWHAMWHEMSLNDAEVAGQCVSAVKVVAGRGSGWHWSVAFQTGYAGSIPVARSNMSL